MLLQRFLSRDRIEKELALFFVLLGAGAVAAGLRHVIAPFVVELGELLELGFEILVGRGRCRRFLGRVRIGFGREFFQDRIGLHLLLDEVAELEKWRLENEQALLQLGRKNLLEREVLRLVHPRASHDVRRYASVVAKSKQLPRRRPQRNTTCF